jgi:glucosylceramidase
VAAAVHRPARAGENGDGDTLWVVTTQTAPWRAALDARYVEGGGAPDVLIDEAKPGQTIEGFGACFNELGWDALSYAPAAARHEILREFFGPDGARFSLCRMPVGANDFSRDWYSYDEARGDFGLERFSVANDDATLVPFIKAALAFRPDLGLWASPWSPPTWMKTNGHYAAAMNRPTWPANGLRPDQVGREGSDMFILEPKYLEAYGRYFGKFIDAYRDRGVRIGMVMPQNEFNSAQVFPSCCWTPEGLAAFIPYLGEQMSRRGVEVFLGTLERPDDGLYEKVAQDPKAGPYIKGVGVQWAGKGAAPYIHRNHPQLRIYQSEQECGDGRNDWRYARYAWSLMKHYLRNGASAYQYWNMALLDGGVSRWGWAQNSLVTIDKRTGAHRYNHEYWLMKHLSHFVPPGARRLEAVSWTGYEDVLAFRNPDGATILIAHNPLGEAMPIKIAVGQRQLQAVLPPDSFSTLRVAT